MERAAPVTCRMVRLLHRPAELRGNPAQGLAAVMRHGAGESHGEQIAEGPAGLGPLA